MYITIEWFLCFQNIISVQICIQSIVGVRANVIYHWTFLHTPCPTAAAVKTCPIIFATAQKGSAASQVSKGKSQQTRDIEAMPSNKTNNRLGVSFPTMSQKRQRGWKAPPRLPAVASRRAFKCRIADAQKMYRNPNY